MRCPGRRGLREHADLIVSTFHVGRRHHHHHHHRFRSLHATVCLTFAQNTISPDYMILHIFHIGCLFPPVTLIKNDCNLFYQTR